MILCAELELPWHTTPLASTKLYTRDLRPTFSVRQACRSYASRLPDLSYFAFGTLDFGEAIVAQSLLLTPTPDRHTGSSELAVAGRAAESTLPSAPQASPFPLQRPALLYSISIRYSVLVVAISIVDGLWSFASTQARCQFGPDTQSQRLVYTQRA